MGIEVSAHINLLSNVGRHKKDLQKDESQN